MHVSGKAQETQGYRQCLILIVTVNELGSDDPKKWTIPNTTEEGNPLPPSVLPSLAQGRISY